MEVEEKSKDNGDGGAFYELKSYCCDVFGLEWRGAEVVMRIFVIMQYELINLRSYLTNSFVYIKIN